MFQQTKVPDNQHGRQPRQPTWMPPSGCFPFIFQLMSFTIFYRKSDNWDETFPNMVCWGVKDRAMSSWEANWSMNHDTNRSLLAIQMLLTYFYEICVNRVMWTFDQSLFVNELLFSQCSCWVCFATSFNRSHIHLTSIWTWLVRKGTCRPI